MEEQRWGDTPMCARCESENVYRMTDRKTGKRNKRYLWRCQDCGKQYTVRIGTVFEDSRIELFKWCHAFWRACASKKGVSALQISRELRISYKSALFMMHRIRWAMAPANAKGGKLSGTVEIDETYVGGKPRFRSWKNPGRYHKTHAPVVALVQRDGDVRASHVMRVRSVNLRRLMHEAVEKNARIMTDSSPIYIKPGREYVSHESVNHFRREYARGDAHVNSAESFFALFKRALYGTYHSVSKRHLHRYVSQAQYMWNTRKMDDGARTALAIQAAQGRRMIYRASAGKTS